MRTRPRRMAIERTAGLDGVVIEDKMPWLEWNAGRIVLSPTPANAYRIGTTGYANAYGSTYGSTVSTPMYRRDSKYYVIKYR
jgi:hypothetical protein